MNEATLGGDGPHAALLLAAGVGVIVGLAALVPRHLRSAVWQRTVWQAALLGVAGLSVLELSGLSSGLTALFARRSARQEAAAASTVHEARGTEYGVRHAMSGELGGPGGPRGEAFGVQNALGDLPDTAVLSSTEATGDRGDAQPGDPRLVPSLSASNPALSASSAATHASYSVLALAGLWLAGTLALLGRAVWSRILLARFRHRLRRPVDVRIASRLGVLAGQLGVRRPAEAWESDGLAAPVAFGIGRPALVLPTGFADQFDPAEQEAMLAHELAHLASGDPAWKLAAELAVAMLWWHPLVWWLRRRLHAASEAAADEASLLVPDGPSVLASCLVAVGTRLAGRRRLGWLAIEGAGFRSALGRRVERLLTLDPGACRPPCRGRLTLARAALPAGLVIVAVSCTAWARPQVVTMHDEGGTTMSVLARSWRQSLAAAVVLALWSQGPATAAAAEEKKDEPAARAPQPPEREAGRREEGNREEGRREEHARGERREETAPREGRRERADREHGDRPRGEREGAELRERMQELQRRAEAIREQARNLKPHDDEAAQKLRAQMREVETAMQALRGQHGDTPPRERIQARMAEIKEAMHKAREAGNREMVEKLEQEARKLMQMSEGGPRPEGPPQGREEIARKLHHLQAAAENLRAAGLNEAADRIQRQAEELARAAGGNGPMPPGPPPGAGPDRPMGPPEALQHEVRELREEVQRLHHQMDEMREVLKRVAGDRPPAPPAPPPPR